MPLFYCSDLFGSLDFMKSKIFNKAVSFKCFRVYEMLGFFVGSFFGLGSFGVGGALGSFGGLGDKCKSVLMPYVFLNSTLCGRLYVSVPSSPRGSRLMCAWSLIASPTPSPPQDL